MTTPGGYPKDIENPDQWAAFLARYVDNRVTNEVHDGIGLLALHIVDAIREAHRWRETVRDLSDALHFKYDNVVTFQDIIDLIEAHHPEYFTVPRELPK